MKNLLLLFMLISNIQSSFGQVKNPDFESWEIVFGDEQPEYWYCNGAFLGACTRDSISLSSNAVRMDNSLPCVDSSDPSIGKSLGNGTLTQYFKPPSTEFILSYDLIIDSLEKPAEFRVRIIDPILGNVLFAKHSELFNGTVSHNISISPDSDSLTVQLEPVGNRKAMAEHDCDLGYISAVIDNIRALQFSSTSDFEYQSVSIYPSPSDGLIYIKQKTLEINRIEVYDHLGRFLMNHTVSRRDLTSLDLNAFTGLMFLRIIYENGQTELETIILT